MELGVFSRSGGQVGSEFALRTASGVRLEEISGLLFSDDRIQAEVATVDPLPFTEERLPNHGNFVVKISPETPPGRYEVRAVGRHGVSNPRAFLVTRYADHLPAVSHDLAKPADLPVNHLAHAAATAAQVDYYRLKLESGQQVRIDLIAQRLDSWMIGHLKVIDPEGRIVETARGSDAIDPSVSFTAAMSGDYVIALHDFLYRGGTDLFYQVIARIGDERASDLIGGDAKRWGPLESATLTSLDAKPVEESTTHSITPPCSVAATFDWRDDEDVYEFTANQGDQYAIDVVSSRIGQPTDARLVVLRVEPQESGEPKLTQVATADDSQNVGGVEMPLRSRDPVVMFNAPAQGTYRILVRDLDTGESLGKTQQYRLTVRKPTPRFDLVAFRPFPNKDANQSRHFGSKMFRAGSEAIRLLAVRHDGWSGPINVTVEGLPAGITCAPATMAANQTQLQLTLVAAEDTPPWRGPVSVVGTANLGGQETKVNAIAATFRSGKAHARDFIQSRLCDQLVIASTNDLSPLTVGFGAGDAVEGKKKGSVKVPVQLTRRDGGKAAVVFRGRDLPPGVTVGDVTVAADKSAGEVELKVSDKAVAGTYSLWLQAETKIKVKPNPEVLARAEQYRAHLQKLHDDPAQAANLAAIKEAIKAADARVAAAKPNANDQELTVYIPSPHLTFRVVDP